MGSARIELRHVTKRFGDVRALDDVTFTVEPGTLVALLGPSGCGKTTTLRLIAGLDFVTAGEVLLDGADVSALPPAERRVALVSAHDTLFVHASVRENVASGARSAGLPPEEALARAGAMLDTVRLGELAHRLPSELSSGQRQRVVIARALAREPAVLLLDEPLSSLDPDLRRDVRNEIRELQRRLGLTVLYVTHDHAEARAIADHVLVMRDGRLVDSRRPV